MGKSLPTVSERVAALSLVPRLFRLVWDVQPVLTALMILLRFVRSAVPVTVLWVAKLIIDEVVMLAGTGRSTKHLWFLVAVEMMLIVVSELLARLVNLVEELLTDCVSHALSLRILAHAATLDLHHFEDPQFHDQLERAKQGSSGRIVLIGQLLGIGQSVLTLTSLTLALAAQFPWLMLLLVVAVSPSFMGETHFASVRHAMLFRRTPERRKLDYVRHLGASRETAKEVQLFGLSSWLIDRYRALSERFYRETKALATRRMLVSSSFVLLSTLGYYAAYIAILNRAVTGAISIGMLTFLAGSFRQSRDLLQGVLTSVTGIYEQSLYLKDLFAFFDLTPSIVTGPRATRVPRPIRNGFEFQDVGFRYPGSNQWAVRHLSFALHRGERVALVGENGAGKTTVAKLLARLYDVSEGRILLDGVDLREYDIGDVRRAIGVIFQDFVRYDMRFDENIGIGEIEAVRAHLDAETAEDARAVPTPSAILAAAEKSLADSLLPRLPGAYRQLLGRRFHGGVELSGGEWQKVALARAYMRDAQVVILDEPTAALDARAEYDVFSRFNEWMAGRMALLISHRFSTVRMADRIIVLQRGRIVEEGTHDALISGGALYAELFEMQAASYR